MWILLEPGEVVVEGDEMYADGLSYPGGGTRGRWFPVDDLLIDKPMESKQLVRRAAERNVESAPTPPNSAMDAICPDCRKHLLFSQRQGITCVVCRNELPGKQHQ